MAELLEIREYLKGIFSRYDIYIEPVLKFALTVVALMVIGMTMGYDPRLQNPGLIIIVGLLCSFMPLGVPMTIAAVFCVIHLYALSLESAVVVLALFLTMFLVFFRFVPGDSLQVLLTPLCFAIHIPYVIPICCGLAGGPMSGVAACLGLLVYYVLEQIRINEAVITGMEDESTVQKFRFIVDSILSNKTMLVMLAAFAVTVILVYIIRRLSVDHAWTIAMFAGFFSSLIIVLLGSMSAGVDVSVPGVLIGEIVSLGIAAVLKFFLFSVDYTRTENLQFEDDEYYYYVKAVPKMTVSVPQKQVKHINQRRDTSEDRGRRRSAKDYPVFNQTRLDDTAEDLRTDRPSSARRPSGGSSSQERTGTAGDQAQRGRTAPAASYQSGSAQGRSTAGASGQGGGAAGAPGQGRPYAGGAYGASDSRIRPDAGARPQGRPVRGPQIRPAKVQDPYNGSLPGGNMRSSERYPASGQGGRYPSSDTRDDVRIARDPDRVIRRGSSGGYEPDGRYSGRGTQGTGGRYTGRNE